MGLGASIQAALTGQIATPVRLGRSELSFRQRWIPEVGRCL